MAQIQLPPLLTQTFWDAQAAYTRLEARENNKKEYQRKSRLIGEYFARAFDKVLQSAGAGEDNPEDAIRYLRRIVQECDDPPTIQSHPATITGLRIPDIIFQEASWARSIIRPIRRTTALPTRTRMEVRDALFHLVIANAHSVNRDVNLMQAHIAMAREHLILSGEEALEYAIRENLRKVSDAFEHSKRSLDISIALANAVDQSRIAVWRLILDLAALAVDHRCHPGNH